NADRYTADQALARLKAGNQRFLRGRARFPTVRKEVLAELAKEQRPYATIIGCSDSRVPPELLFDAHFGELFIVRVGRRSRTAPLHAFVGSSLTSRMASCPPFAASSPRASAGRTSPGSSTFSP